MKSMINIPSKDEFLSVDDRELFFLALLNSMLKTEDEDDEEEGR